MKLKEKKDLREKSLDDLKKSIDEKRKDLFSAKLEHMQGKLKNMRSLKAMRISIAQILTIIKEKEVSEHGKNI